VAATWVGSQSWTSPSVGWLATTCAEVSDWVALNVDCFTLLMAMAERVAAMLRAM
jgi:hypothetical protein